jgi:hypothetical protein
VNAAGGLVVTACVGFGSEVSHVGLQSRNCGDARSTSVLPIASARAHPADKGPDCQCSWGGRPVEYSGWRGKSKIGECSYPLSLHIPGINVKITACGGIT